MSPVSRKKISERVAPEPGSKRSRGTVDDFAVTPHDRGKSVIAQSPAAAKAYLDRSGVPLILPKDVKLTWQGMMSVAALMELAVDKRYQREEITSEVNMLIHVLNHGGQIPDPVTIAERKDGSRWIVDGQQRWWAHVDAGKPMQARVFAVDSYEQELTLFHVLNNSRKLSARERLRSWPRAAGDAISWMDTGQDSPLKGLMSFKDGNGPYPVVTVMRGLATATVGSIGNGSIDRVASNYDRVHAADKKWVDKATRFYAHVVASVFGAGTPLRHLPALALGRILYATWRPLSIDDAWPTPSPKQCARLKKLDWDALSPGSATQWLPILVSAIRNIWGESGDPDEYARSRGKKGGE